MTWFNRVMSIVVALAIVGAAYLVWPKAASTTVTGDFSRAVGLYPGSAVRVLGVEVGEVTQVEPRGDRVQVTFEFDDDVQVPAEAKAVIVAPSLVSDRYIQLFPAYTSGPAMQDGAEIPKDRTGVPVELDRISDSLNDLMVALGPEGANKDGAFSRLLRTGAANLNGQGQNLNDMTVALSQAVTTFSEGRGDLFTTVDNLRIFTEMLATNDQQVRRLNQDLSQVADQLDGERDDLAAALKNLGIALNEVSTFVADNRDVLTEDVEQLAGLTGAVAEKQDSLARTLDNAPVALSNLQQAYNPTSGTLDTRANLFEALNDPATLLCTLITGATNTADSGLCDTLGQLIPRGGLPISGLLSPLGQGSAVPQTMTIGSADPTLGGFVSGGTR